jgi:hypothetical protein
VRGDAEEDLAFAEVHADEGEIEHFEVAEAAVDEAGGARGGAAAEVTFFDEGDAGATEGEIAGDTGADDAAADDGDVEGALGGSRHELF